MIHVELVKSGNNQMLMQSKGQHQCLILIEILNGKWEKLHQQRQQKQSIST
jgi:hypothetical protein